MYVVYPKISIITVSYNAVNTIEDSIRSVIGQTYRNIEYIVVDGYSTDGTVEKIEMYARDIDTVICERDGGIAEAMNKGLYQARGQFIIYVNADDYLVDKSTIERIVPLLDNELVCAPILRQENGCKKKVVRPSGFGLWFNFKIGKGFHQSVIALTRVLVELGGFDPRFEVAMDYELFMRAYRRGYKVKKIETPLMVMRVGGVSGRKDAESLSRRLTEEKAVHVRHSPNLAVLGFYKCYWQFYWPYRMFRGVLERRKWL